MEAEARMHERDSSSYKTVLRLQCIALALEEKHTDVFNLNGFWGALSVMQKKRLAQMFSEFSERASALSQQKSHLEWKKRSETISQDNILELHQSIIVTADSCSKVKGSGSNVILMNSFCGFNPSSNVQLHQRSNGSFYFNIVSKSSSQYLLSAEVVTVHADQEPFQLSITDSSGSTRVAELPIPYTIGEWSKTPIISIYLGKGRNKVVFSRKEGSLGVSIKLFELMEVEPID